LIPVALPPGRARLAIRPNLTGSSATPKTIGIVVVAALAAGAAVVKPGVAITATRRRTKSAISAGKRSYWPSSQWYSTVTFWPSMAPVSLGPLRNAAPRRADSWGDRGADNADDRQRRLLRARRQRPRCRAAERSYQFPPSDVDWHEPLSVRGLPRERKRYHAASRRASRSGMRDAGAASRLE